MGWLCPTGEAAQNDRRSGSHSPEWWLNMHRSIQVPPIWDGTKGTSLYLVFYGFSFTPIDFSIK